MPASTSLDCACWPCEEASQQGFNKLPSALQPAAPANSSAHSALAERPGPGPATSSCSKAPMACIAAPPGAPCAAAQQARGGPQRCMFAAVSSFGPLRRPSDGPSDVAGLRGRGAGATPTPRGKRDARAARTVGGSSAAAVGTWDSLPRVRSRRSLVAQRRRRARARRSFAKLDGTRVLDSFGHLRGAPSPKCAPPSPLPTCKLHLLTLRACARCAAAFCARASPLRARYCLCGAGPRYPGLRWVRPEPCAKVQGAAPLGRKRAAANKPSHPRVRLTFGTPGLLHAQWAARQGGVFRGCFPPGSADRSNASPCARNLRGASPYAPWRARSCRTARWGTPGQAPRRAPLRPVAGAAEDAGQSGRWGFNSPATMASRLKWHSATRRVSRPFMRCSALAAVRLRTALLLCGFCEDAEFRAAWGWHRPALACTRGPFLLGFAGTARSPRLQRCTPGRGSNAAGPPSGVGQVDPPGGHLPGRGSSGGGCRGDMRRCAPRLAQRKVV